MAIKIQFRHIMSVLLVLFVSCNMSSCIFDKEDTDEDILQEGDADQALFVLHITPMNTRALPEDGVQEKIKSLRVIAISKGKNGESDVIEMNRRVDFDDVLSAKFGYSFTWYTTQGEKDFYIIANEESVNSGDEDNTISYLADLLPNGVSAEILPKTLTELLNQYKATLNPEDRITEDQVSSGDDLVSSILTDNKQAVSADDDDDAKANAQKKAKEFKDIMKAVYFEPKYNPTDGEGGTREIFLPYSACYENVDVKAWKDNDNAANEQTMYLVPVATKFHFRFYNYHNNEVEIKELSINSIASENFLLGNVDETEQTKTFDDVAMYWIDWLAKVAEKTKDSQLDNEEVNEQYGWISAFQMPASNTHDEAVLISEEKNNGKIIPVWTKEKEEVLYLGPYYFPESHNEQDGDGGKIQQYTLGLHLHDKEVDSSTSNDFKEDLVIGNVKSLFRSTCVLIQVTMKNGNVEAYAETTDWEHKEVDGWAEGGSIMK